MVCKVKRSRHDKKLEQNEDLANLRADTAIELNQMMSADVKLTSDAYEGCET